MKSKKQKQQEALAKLRARYSEKLDQYISVLYGSAGYMENVRNHGQEYAAKIAHDSNRRFVEYCAEAKIDKHGNPLD